MIRQSYIKGLRKQADYITDELYSIPGAVGTLGLSYAGYTPGLVMPRVSAKQIKQMDQSPEKALIPFVGPYRQGARRRFASSDKNAKPAIMHQALGTSLTGLGSMGVGALAGHLIGGAGGASTGAAAGVGLWLAASLVGAGLGLIDKPRTKAQQQYQDKTSTAKKYLIPGYSTYTKTLATRSASNIADEQLSGKQDKQDA